MTNFDYNFCEMLNNMNALELEARGLVKGTKCYNNVFTINTFFNTLSIQYDLERVDQLTVLTKCLDAMDALMRFKSESDKHQIIYRVYNSFYDLIHEFYFENHDVI